MTDTRGWNQLEVIGARRIILETALAVLAGGISPTEGARKIAATCHAAKLEDDANIRFLVGVASEFEALPLGSERVHWRAQALTSLQSEIDKAQDRARDDVLVLCQNLLARAASLLKWP